MRRFYRYQETPAQQSTFELKSKQLNNNSAFVTPTAAKNPESQLIRLPQLNSLRRSASVITTERNTKFKLVNLEQKIEELSADVHNTRLQAQETINHIYFLRQSFAVNELGKLREDLKKQVKGLQRLMRSIQGADQDRSKTIKQDCSQLWRQTEGLHQSMFELRMRTEQIERSMGFGCKNSQ